MSRALGADFFFSTTRGSMELLKLIYISHGWYLEIYDLPLIRNRIEAWKHGPVIPDVYYAFRSQGLNVREQIRGIPVLEDDSVIDVLEQVYSQYGHFEGWQLSRLTHVEGGPWHVTMEIGGPFTPIPDSLIKRHYKEKREEYSG